MVANSLPKFFAAEVRLDECLPKLEQRAILAVTSLLAARDGSAEAVGRVQNLLDALAKLGTKRETLSELMKHLSLGEALFPFSNALRQADVATAPGKAAFLEEHERDATHLLSLCQQMQEAGVQDMQHLMAEAETLKETLTRMASEVVTHKLTEVTERLGAIADGDKWKEGLSANPTWTHVVEKSKRLVDHLALPLDEAYKQSEEAR